MRLFDTLTRLVQLDGTSVSLAGNLCVLAKKFIEGLFCFVLFCFCVVCVCHLDCLPACD